MIPGWPKKRSPTDLELVNAIHDDYYETFVAFGKEAGRNSKIYVPIDIQAIAGALAVDPHIVFGRLYYHLNQKYGYKNDDGSKVHLFALKVGGDRDCVNFPLISALVAALRDEDKKYRIATGTALLALGISLISSLVSLSY